jgi:4-amino-4-deoxy-L-arabinose transferase-like glycosyltransferase
MTRLAASRRVAHRWLDPIADGWGEVWLGLAIAFAYLGVLLATVDQLGYARDEGFYFHAARSYQAWFALCWRDPSAALAAVDSYWQVNSEHPALLKSLFALSHALFGGVFAREGTSYRFAAMVVSSIGIGLVYLWGARASGRVAGIVAAGSLAAMPRFFYHAHLACFDAPVVTLWTLCAYAWWRSLTRGGWWPLWVGIAFGLALDTKHNAWFLPIVCALHAAVALAPNVSRGIARREIAARAARSLAAMMFIGPLVFYALWPWIWHDTLPRLSAYASFHLRHVYYNMEFLGENHWQPPMPRGYAFVMTAATVPTVTLVLFLVGVGARLKRDVWPAMVGRVQRGSLDAATTLLWLGAIGVQYAAWLLPTTPIFGGTKHWMTAYPFVVLFAGSAVVLALRTLRVRWARRPSWSKWLSRPSPEACMVAAALFAPVVLTAHSHPWALSHYVPLVGGTSGGATLGLNRGFWGYQTGAIAPYLDDTVKRGGSLFVHDTAAPSWEMLVRDGTVRADIRALWNASTADVAIYHHEKHMAGVEYQSWILFGTQAPDHIAGLDGVPVIWTYKR